jgi:hypothetical protein
MALIFFNKPAVVSVRLDDRRLKFFGDIFVTARDGNTFGKFP